MSDAKLSPPWVTYYRQLKELFGPDKQIAIQYIEDPPKIVMRFRNQKKYDAISQLLPTEKQFGNVTMSIILVPPNTKATSKYGELFETAFEGNPVVEGVCVSKTPVAEMTYVVFQKEVVQFYNDELTDMNGLKTTLYQDIAREVFDTPANVGFCTALQAPKPIIDSEF